MAFVNSACPTLSTMTAPGTSSKCSLDTVIRIIAPSAAALLLAVTSISPQNVLADEGVLIFDHDQSLTGADFSNRSDLRGAIFSKSNCKGATFSGSDLTNAQLDDANMQGTNFEGATLSNIMATNAKFQNSNLKNADFSGANLVSAVFDGAVIEGADFTDSLLGKAATAKLCRRASGTNPKTGVATAESLMCPE